ncbi:uncharacterized protein A4U43_C04F12610 [Asparagus officinalis]|uniref:Uncharacterized protein n=1 Tax=Asparagus officinalis TaxID=4686 RepID=A0A5P1F0B9_ASPOF|nr:uncharacterized protein A4U43_C04F12610 [Asparagus officinalis]
MAVQAQYPSNLLLFNRSGEQEKKEMDYSQQPPGFFEQAPLFFANGENGNQRKRTRESSASTSALQRVPNPQIQMINLYSPSIQSPALMNLAQLQNQTHHLHHHPPPSLVSTGLKLSFEDNHQSQPNPFAQQDLASLINHQRDEIEHYLIAQGEQLRRTLAERTSRHYRALLAAGGARPRSSR